jgi:hypothetical protein
VQCRTCQGNHKYKPAPSDGASSLRKSGTTRTRATGTRETRGRRGAEAAGADLAPAKDYSMRERFAWAIALLIPGLAWDLLSMSAQARSTSGLEKRFARWFTASDSAASAPLPESPQQR